MATRFFQSIGVLGLLVGLTLFLNAQAPPPPDKAAPAGPAPKTAWGAPDLQGIWTNTHEVPLQRPARYANKEFFTDEERAELDKQRTAIVSQDVRRYETRKRAGRRRRLRDATSSCRTSRSAGGRR